MMPEKELKKESTRSDVGDHEVVTTTISTNEEISRKEGIRPIFYAKVLVLNRAIAEVGMGKYQVSSQFDPARTTWPHQRSWPDDCLFDIPQWKLFLSAGRWFCLL